MGTSRNKERQQQHQRWRVGTGAPRRKDATGGGENGAREVDW